MSVWRSRDAPRGRVRSTVSLLRGGGGFLFRHIRTIRNYVLWRANIKTLPCFWSDWRQMSISVVSHASYLPYPKVGLKLNIRRRGERERERERGITGGWPPANGKWNRFSEVLHVCVELTPCVCQWGEESGGGGGGGVCAESMQRQSLSDALCALKLSWLHPP